MNHYNPSPLTDVLFRLFQLDPREVVGRSPVLVEFGVDLAGEDITAVSGRSKSGASEHRLDTAAGCARSPTGTMCRPGFAEADLVTHCGGDPGGHFLHTLVITDVVTGWTECQALVGFVSAAIGVDP